jgi:hypothetical protein
MKTQMPPRMSIMSCQQIVISSDLQKRPKKLSKRAVQSHRSRKEVLMQKRMAGKKSKKKVSLGEGMSLRMQPVPQIHIYTRYESTRLKSPMVSSKNMAQTSNKYTQRVLKVT